MGENKLKMTGCLPEPFMSNLKALGLFRTVSEQVDPDATGFWENDVFVLNTNMTADELIRFFVDRYVPTPIVSPWNNGSGFYDLEHTGMDKIRNSGDSRMKKYGDVIDQAQRIITELIPEYGKFLEEKSRTNLDKKSQSATVKQLKSISDKEKTNILRQCRNRLPDSVIPWLDAAYVSFSDKPSYGALLGTGGNDGHFDISSNFMEWASKLFIDDTDENKKTKPSIYSRRTELLQNALFGEYTKLEKSSFAYFHPGRYASLATIGKKISILNPWDFILTIEGTMMFAGSISRRSSSNRIALFPFTVNSSAAGYDTACKEKSRKEIWIPLWENPARYDEIRHIFSEGRAQIGTRNQNTGVDFAKSITSLGTERGLSRFERFGMFERKGQAYFATHVGSIKVTERKATALLLDIDEWINKIKGKQNQLKNPPKTIGNLLKNMDDAVIGFCTFGQKRYLHKILIMAGRLERAVSQSSNLQDVGPMPRLSHDWINQCDDGTAEYRLALSVATISANNEKQIRRNIIPIDNHVNYPKWKMGSVSAVWNNTDLVKNMIAVLNRRYLEARMEDSSPQMKSLLSATVKDVMDFIEEKTDDRKISDLIPALAAINYDPKKPPKYLNNRDIWGIQDLIPEPYIVLKSNFPPMSYKGTNKKAVYEPTILGLLKAKRIQEAIHVARRRLVITGHPISTHRKSKDANTIMTTRLMDRVTASLLFPLHEPDRKKITKSLYITTYRLRSSLG